MQTRVCPGYPGSMNDMLNKLKEAAVAATHELHLDQIAWGNLAGEGNNLETAIERTQAHVADLEEQLANAKNTVEVLNNLLRANARKLQETGDRVRTTLKAKQELDRILERLEPSICLDTFDLDEVPDNVAAE